LQLQRNHILTLEPSSPSLQSKSNVIKTGDSGRLGEFARCFQVETMSPRPSIPSPPRSFCSISEILPIFQKFHDRLIGRLTLGIVGAEIQDS
jgi:hypothetical protein